MALSRLIATLAALAVTASTVAGNAQTPAPSAARAHDTVSTSDPAAQAAFDRGLALLYAFSVGEARLAFARSAVADPRLAMAHWGEAEAETIDINLPQTDDGDKRGAQAIAEARRLESGASPVEHALIDALAQRYAAGSADRRFRSYADAMNHVAEAFPDDPTVLTLAAYAEWNAVDDLSASDERSTAAAQRMTRELDRALQLDPANIGAHHLRIHLLEELGHAEGALPDARYLDGLTYEPGMSHLPHMAGHVYARVGDYPAMVTANRRALANDALYFAAGDGIGQTYMRRYHSHDLEFVLYGLTTEGLDAEAAAAVASESAPEKLHLALRVHDNARALALSGTFTAPEALRAIALARNARYADAVAVLKPPAGDGFERARNAIASAVIARGQGRLDAAAAAYRLALKLLGGRLGDPKNFWYVPPGEGLGAVLLAASHFPEAEAVFRDELVRYPNDPRLAYGLAEAQAAQGKDPSAARAIVEREWKGARPLTRSDLG